MAATRPTLPYFAPDDTLPPLPSVAEILAAPRPRQRPSVIANVVRIGEHYVVKYGRSVTFEEGDDGFFKPTPADAQTVTLQEGENMLFVQQSTRIRIPTVYAVFHDEDTDMNFIIMEYIKGRGLGEVWDELDRRGKEAVTAQLRRYMDELRGLPSPGYYGGVWGQRVLDGFLTRRANTGAEIHSLLMEPMYTEEDWVEAMIHTTQAQCASAPGYLVWQKRINHMGLRHIPHAAVFTHGDLNPSNIIVQDDGTLVLIDWELSGWYPSYWEFCRSSLGSGSMDEWAEWIDVFLDRHPAELGWMLLFRHGLYGMI